VLVISLAGFTDFMNSKEIEAKPKLAFTLLNQIYLKLDDLVLQYGLFKV
jgi:hypothetical protein